MFDCEMHGLVWLGAGGGKEREHSEDEAWDFGFHFGSGKAAFKWRFESSRGWFERAV
jgi:hypothetical protein